MSSHRPGLARYRDFSSDGAGISDTQPSTSDVPATVFSAAPFWWSASDWYCKHPENKEDQSRIHVIGPHTSEEILQLYKSKQMKGSNLVVGLASRIRPPQPRDTTPFPAAFFRTLAYVFELTKSGTTYAPVTEEDLARGWPESEWCRPLWGMQQAHGTPPQLSRMGSSAGDPASTPTADTPLRSTLSNASAAEKLLSSAPWWCYLYSHDPATDPAKDSSKPKAKKTPPKTSEQMQQYFRDRCLPEWTPILGLDDSVATFNALPPCLFMTLGSLISMTASGEAYKGINDSELQAFDKFSDSRNPTTGSTMGAVGAAPHMASRAGPALRHSQTGSQQQYNGMYVQPQQPQHLSSFIQFQQPGAMYPNSPYQSMSQAGMMWYGSGFPQGQMYRGLPPQALIPAAAVMENPEQERTSDGGPLRQLDREFRTQLSCPAPMLGRQLSKGSAERAAAQAQALAQAQAAGATAKVGRWSTAVFRLFTADATRDNAEAAWWYTAPSNSQIFGPCSDEQMIISYSRGQLTNDHFACGMTSNAGMCPPSSQFERIGTILNAVEVGGEYHLLSASDIISMMEGGDEGERRSYPGQQGSGGEGGRRRGKAPSAPAPRGPNYSNTRQFGVGSPTGSTGRW